jgi:SAM-dependent methyltransferase
MQATSPNTYLWDIENPLGYANAMGRYRTTREREFILAHVIGEQLSILDIGGGSGRFAIPLAERGHSVTVIDISQLALKLLHSRRPFGVSTRLGDFLAQNFENPFDVVIGMESIWYFTSITFERLFAKIHSVLRPGGRFVFTQHNSHSWRYALHKLRGCDVDRYKAGGRNDYLAALRVAGFELLDVEGFVWMPVSVSSNCRLVPMFESIERALHLSRWTGQSPWLLIAAQRPREG